MLPSPPSRSAGELTSTRSLRLEGGRTGERGGRTQIGTQLEELRAAGTYKQFNVLCSPQGPVVQMEGRGEVIVLSKRTISGSPDIGRSCARGSKG